MSGRHPFLIAAFFFAAASTFATGASAYTISAGDITAKAVVGASVNALRLDVATKATPPAAMVIGVDVDYAITSQLGVSGILRPGISPSFVDGASGVGVKYRVTQLDAPFIPYVSAHAVAALGAPLGYGDFHLNFGARAAVGVDYFIMRNLAVGIEVASDATFLVVPLPAPEVSVDALFGVTWRF